MNSKYTNYIPAIVFFAFIIGLIVQVDLNKKNLLIDIVHKIPFGDKLGHFILFGILALLVNMAMRFRKARLLGRHFHIGSVLVLLFAVVEEFSQLAFSSRTFDLVDMLFDLFGVGLLSSIGFREHFIKQLRNLTKGISEKMMVD
ncbi:MAG: VanZ family protein [Fulvivirga sp.]